MNKKITHYGIAAANNTKLLSDQVNKLISDGWQPLGPVVSDTTEERGYYLQTMVCYEP